MSQTAARDTRDPDRTTHDPDSAWLAAYALGLAYSSNGQEEKTDLLLEAADGDPGLLGRASERLTTAEVADPPLRETAQRLLDRARTVERAGTGQGHRQAARSIPGWS